MEGARLGLEVLSTALNAAPIPEPFKSAVTAIPDIALKIMKIVEGVQENVEDAKALAIYIADVTNTTITPFKTKPPESLDKTPDTKKRLTEFKDVLVKILEEMEILMKRKLRKQIFTYIRDASKLAGMKKRVDDAIIQLQLQTLIATGHEVELMGQEQEQISEQQRLVILEQRESHQALLQQQYQMNQQQYLVIQKQEIERLIGSLGNGDSGAAKKDPCLKETRMALLEKIAEWLLDSSDAGKHCLCLLGMAGSGKSAIAASISNRAKASQYLGGRFHFTRDDQERNKGAVLVLARQLANWGDQRLRSEIASAIKDERDIGQMTLEDQFQKLIQEPLENLESTPPALIIVLDALDECDTRFVSTLLRLIGNGLAKLPVTVKYFITSRAEPQLQYYFNSEPMKSQRDVYTLGDEKVELVDKDIGIYLKEKLPEMVGPLVEDSSDWPGEEKRRALVLKAQGLFVWATTAVRIIADPNTGRDPEKKLERLLSSSHQDHLDDIYGQILERACPATIDNDNPETVSLFRNVLGALVVAQEPMNIHTLASLLSPDNSQHKEIAQNIRRNVLRYLQAVFIVPGVDTGELAVDAKPIRFIHTSFIDYLTDTSRCNHRYAINVAEHHERLAIGCLHEMDDLKQNMCDLDPALLNSEVQNLEQRIRDSMSPGLRYACMHMPAHVSHVSTDSRVVMGLVEEFAGSRLMFWLEGLSLMGRIRESVAMVTTIELWLKAKPPQIPLPPPNPTASATPGSVMELIMYFVLILQAALSYLVCSASIDSGSVALRTIINAFHSILGITPPMKCSVHRSDINQSSERQDPALALFGDLRRLVMEFRDPIETSSLHIYNSALIFTPSESHLWRVYGFLVGMGPKIIRGRAKGWSRLLWTVSSSVSCVAIFPDSKTIVSGSHDNTLCLWDAASGATVGEIMTGHTGIVSCVAVSPDNKIIVSGSQDNTLRLWDANNGAAIGEVMAGHTMEVSFVAVSPDNKTVVSGSKDKTLRLWDATSGAAIGEVMTGHTSEIVCIAVSPDSKTIVSGSDDTTLRLWDATSGAGVGEVMTGHTSWVTCVAISPDSKTVVSGSYDNTLRLWDATTGAAVGEVMTGHTDVVTCVAISPGSKTIVSGSEDNTLRLWDANSGAVAGEAMTGHTDWVKSVAISSDNKTIVSGSEDNTLRMWDVASGAPIGEVMAGHTSGVTSVAISPDSKTIVSRSYDSTLRLWDATSGKAVTEVMACHSDTVMCVAVSPDSKTITSGSWDYTLRLWDATSGAAVGEVMTGHTDTVSCVAIAPDSKTIVSGSYDNTLRLWDAASGAAFGEVMTGHTEIVGCVAVSPDSKTIVSGSSDCSLRRWDARSGVAVGEAMTGHTDVIICIAVSPDSKTIVSGSCDCTIRLWDAISGAAVGEVTCAILIGSLTFSVDGKFIISEEDYGENGGNTSDTSAEDDSSILDASAEEGDGISDASAEESGGMSDAPAEEVGNNGGWANGLNEVTNIKEAGDIGRVTIVRTVEGLARFSQQLQFVPDVPITIKKKYLWVR
ncbi:hypothetical protein FRB98_002898 [Tulasnella sp. 332]|nr:hypothetical protein FRB98_002898 [Tulasnella sp. 332]